MLLVPSTVMNSFSIRLLASSLLALAAALPAQIVRSPSVAGEPDYFGYLQIPGITGNVTSPRQYAGWFRVDGYSLGSEALPQMSGQFSTQASTLVVTGDFAFATPLLMMDAIQLPTYQTVTLDIFRDVANPTQLAQIVLGNSKLIGMGSDGESLTGGRLEFLYDQVSWTWILPGGNRTTTWNVATSGAAPYRVEKTPNSAFPRGSYVALLHVPGVRGGSARSGYRDWIDVTDVLSGIQRAAPATARPESTVEVKAYLGPGLPELAQLASVATVYPTVRVHLFRSANDPAPILELELSNAYISSLIHHANAGGASMDLAFEMERITWTYVDPVSGQRTRRCFDFRTFRSC